MAKRVSEHSALTTERPSAGRYHSLFSSRRSLLLSLSRSALVLSFENVLSLARPLFGRGRVKAASKAPASGAASSAKASDLGISFINVAKEAKLNVKTLFGGE